MTAASENRATDTRAGDRIQLPVAASTTIYGGTMVCRNASGYAVPASDLSALEFAGIAVAKADNSSGSAGDINVIVERATIAQWAHSGIVQADEGKEAFAADDQTAQEAGGHVFIGRVHKYVSATEVWINHGPAYNLHVPAPLAPRVFCGELDCENDAEIVQLIPAKANHDGLAILHIGAVVTEAFGGDTEDQGIITVYDSDDTALFTFTAGDAGADAVNDFIQEGGAKDTLVNATSGDAGAVLASAKGLYAKVTQAVSGANAAGKMQIAGVALPLAAPAVDA